MENLFETMDEAIREVYERLGEPTQYDVDAIADELIEFYEDEDNSGFYVTDDMDAWDRI